MMMMMMMMMMMIIIIIIIIIIISHCFQFPCYLSSHTPYLRADLVCAVFSCTQTMLMAASAWDFLRAYRG